MVTPGVKSLYIIIPLLDGREAVTSHSWMAGKQRHPTPGWQGSSDIPLLDGRKAANQTLNSTSPHPDVRPSNNSLLMLPPLLSPTRNNSHLNRQHYLQIMGISVGIQVTPGLAINYIGIFEDKYVYSYHHQLLLYVRYVDTIFMICSNSM